MPRFEDFVREVDRAAYDGAQATVGQGFRDESFGELLILALSIESAARDTGNFSAEQARMLRARAFAKARKKFEHIPGDFAHPRELPLTWGEVLERRAERARLRKMEEPNGS